MNSPLGSGTRSTVGGPDPYRVMVVDDSAVIRGLLTRALEGEADIKVVASVADGQMAVRALQRHEVDVVVLDIEMPVMDGITAIPKLLEVAPQVKIIMASTLTLRNADISLSALRAGAADYIAKPTSTREIHAAQDFRGELVAKVRALGQCVRRGPGAPRREAPARPAAAPVPAEPRPKPDHPPPATRAAGFDGRPDVIAIGSSTGGPQALFEVLGALRNAAVPPILITQHMPATFTTILAEHIARQCGIPCTEAKEGDPVLPGRALVAPGDFHLLVTQRNGAVSINLSKGPPENFCRPAVDPMMRSLIKAFGRRILAVILTGMGQDGLKGCQELVTAGGTVVGQDEATSVVWGMPGAVATAGLCSAILPLRDIGPYIRRIAVRAAE